jgi:Xaa-Pro aminopeptidase
MGLKRTPLGGRFLYPVSDAELERRWGLIRAIMKKTGVDLLIVQNEGQDLGGYVRWLSDIPAGYPVTIIFQMNDGMIMINSSGVTRPLPPEFMRRGISKAIGRPYFRTVNPTNEVDAEVVVEEVKKTGKKNIGLVNLGRMHASFYIALTRGLSKCNFVDITDEIDCIKAVKSAEELEVAQAVCDLEDEVMAAVPYMIRPGRRELDVRNDIHDMCLRLGAEGQFFLTVSSSPMNTICGQIPLLYEGKIIQENENISVLIESSGPGGFFAELQRTVCTGEPSEQLMFAWEKAVEVQKICATMLVPGGDPTEVFGALNQFLESNGFAQEERLFAHGQGYDLIERPALMPGETMKFVENMFITLHPAVVNQFAMCTCADNFLITKKGGMRLHKTPQDIFIAE